ncbi:MAG: hypothetical protein HOO96_31700, partial [Polyangiaceae bacterium]|nr:hypothetical protein [Polyangiaceae bacterium]
MKKILQLAMIMVMSLASARAWAAPVVSIVSPVPNGGAAREAGVDVVFSTPITERTTTNIEARLGANVAPKEWFLCTNDALSTTCRANVPTAGLPRGPASLTVEVTDSFGEVGRASVSVRVDDAPSISGVRSGALITQSSLTVRCTDAGLYPCASIRVERLAGTYGVVATGATSATLPLAAFDGVSLTGQLRAVAVDTIGIETIQPLDIVVDLTPGLAHVSRVDGTVVQVNEGYILFTNTAGLWIRNRRTGVDTQLSTYATGFLTNEGAIFRDDLGIGSLWAGTFTRGLAGLRDVRPQGSNGRILVYGETSFADTFLCYTRDLATGIESVALDLRPYFGSSVHCDGVAVSPGGTLYYDATPISGGLSSLMRVEGATVTALFAPQFKRWVAADDAGHVAYAALRTLPTDETTLFFDGSIVGSGRELGLRDGFFAFAEGTGFKVRRPDGTIVD